MMSSLEHISSLSGVGARSAYPHLPTTTQLVHTFDPHKISGFPTIQQEYIQKLLSKELFETTKKAEMLCSSMPTEDDEGVRSRYLGPTHAHRNLIMHDRRLDKLLDEYLFHLQEVRRYLENISAYHPRDFGGSAGLGSRIAIKNQKEFLKSFIPDREKQLKSLTHSLHTIQHFLEHIEKNPRIEAELAESGIGDEEHEYESNLTMILQVDPKDPYEDTHEGEDKKTPYKVSEGRYKENDAENFPTLESDAAISYLLMHDEVLQKIFGPSLYKEKAETIERLKKEFSKTTGREYILKKAGIDGKEKHLSDNLATFVSSLHTKTTPELTHLQNRKTADKYSKKNIAVIDTLWVDLKESVAIALIAHLYKEQKISAKIQKASLSADLSGSDFFLVSPDGKKQSFDLKITDGRYTYEKDPAELFCIPKQLFLEYMQLFLDRLINEPENVTIKDLDRIIEEIAQQHRPLCLQIKNEITKKF